MPNQTTKKRRNPWFCLGIVTGFFCGFLYFAVGVYHHGKEKNAPYLNEDYALIHAGAKP